MFLIDGISYEITGTPTVGNPVFSLQKDTKTALFSLSDDKNGEAELRITTDDGESVYRSPMKDFRFLSNYLKTN
ncbi:MAG: hypothetical protein MJ175_00805 [Clostridia bacterium]|nr:hypothetical protein [Clostridia bacterium]